MMLKYSKDVYEPVTAKSFQSPASASRFFIFFSCEIGRYSCAAATPTDIFQTIHVSKSNRVNTSKIQSISAAENAGTQQLPLFQKRNDIYSRSQRHFLKCTSLNLIHLLETSN